MMRSLQNGHAANSNSNNRNKQDAEDDVIRRMQRDASFSAHDNSTRRGGGSGESSDDDCLDDTTYRTDHPDAGNAVRGGDVEDPRLVAPMNDQSNFTHTDTTDAKEKYQELQASTEQDTTAIETRRSFLSRLLAVTLCLLIVSMAAVGAAMKQYNHQLNNNSGNDYGGTAMEEDEDGVTVVPGSQEEQELDLKMVGRL